MPCCHVSSLAPSAVDHDCLALERRAPFGDNPRARRLSNRRERAVVREDIMGYLQDFPESPVLMEFLHIRGHVGQHR